jgi:hypothetical protein
MIDKDSMYNIIEYLEDPLLLYNVSRIARYTTEDFIYNFKISNDTNIDAVIKNRKLEVKSIYVLLNKYKKISNLSLKESDLINIFIYQSVPENVIKYIICNYNSRMYNRRYKKYSNDTLNKCYHLIPKYQQINVSLIRSIYKLNSDIGIELLKTYFVSCKKNISSFITSSDDFNYIKDILLENGEKKILVLYFKRWYIPNKPFKLEPHVNAQYNKLLKYIFESYLNRRLDIDIDIENNHMKYF